MFDFESNATVEDVNSVPEQFRGLYEQTEVEGNKVFTISESAKGIVEAYVGTNKSLDQARNDKKAASDESAGRRKSLKEYDTLYETLGIDEKNPEALKTYLDDLAAKASNGDEIRVNLDKIKADYEKRMNEALETKDGEIVNMTSALHSHLVKDVATRELANAKGSIELLLPHVETQCKVVKGDSGYEVRVVDAQGDFRSDGSGGWLGVQGLVTEMKSKEQFGRAFESEIKQGAGTPPGGASRGAPKNTQEMTSVDKIAAGLSAISRGG